MTVVVGNEMPFNGVSEAEERRATVFLASLGSCFGIKSSQTLV